MITSRFHSDYDNDIDLETMNSIPRVPTCNIPHSHYKAQYMKSLLRVYIYNTSNLFDRKTNLNVWSSVHSPAPVQAVYKLAPISPTNGKRITIFLLLLHHSHQDSQFPLHLHAAAWQSVLLKIHQQQMPILHHSNHLKT